MPAGRAVASRSHSSLRRLRLGRIGSAAQLLLGLVLVYWLVESGRLDFSVYRELFAPGRLGLVVTILLLQFASYFVYVFRWWGLARIVDVPVSRSEVLRTGFQGLFLGLVLPGSSGVDGLRLLHLQRAHSAGASGHRSAGLAAILVDRLSGYLGLLVLGTGASLAAWLASGHTMLALIFGIESSLLLVLAILMLTAIAGVSFPGRRLIERFGPAARMLAALTRFAAARRALVGSIGLAILSHVLSCVAWWLAFEALGDPPSIGVVAAITSILVIARTLPITPMGLGVTDGLAEALYRSFGVSLGSEAQMLIRATAILIFLASGLAFVFGARIERHASNEVGPET